MRRLFIGLLSLGLLASAPDRGDEPVFSGPQAGEKLTPFTMTGVFDESAGRKIDLVSTAGGKPILLVFVHEANRPSIAVSRALLNYRAGRAKDGLVSGLVWLADHATAADQFLKRARGHSPRRSRSGSRPTARKAPEPTG